MPDIRAEFTDMCERVTITTRSYLARNSKLCTCTVFYYPPDLGPCCTQEVGGAGTDEGSSYQRSRGGAKRMDYGNYPHRITGPQQPRNGKQRAARHAVGISQRTQSSRCVHCECVAVHTPCSITLDVRTLRYRVASEPSGQLPASEYPEGSDLRQKMLMILT